MEQLSLFDMDKVIEAIQNVPEDPSVVSSAPVVTAVPKKPETPIKPVLPESTLNKLNELYNLNDICRFASTDTAYLSYGNVYSSKTLGYKVELDGARKAEYRYRNQTPLMEEMQSIHIRIGRNYSHSEDKQTIVY